MEIIYYFNKFYVLLICLEISCVFCFLHIPMEETEINNTCYVIILSASLFSQVEFRCCNWRVAAEALELLNALFYCRLKMLLLQLIVVIGNFNIQGV